MIGLIPEVEEGCRQGTRLQIPCRGLKALQVNISFLLEKAVNDFKLASRLEDKQAD
jgi:hypothetical protein